MRTWILGSVLLVATSQAARADWPQFRGPLGDGVVPAGPGMQPNLLPLKWSESQNVIWKAPIPHKGWSTPVVMQGRIWLTTAAADGHDFFAICVDEATGHVLINKMLFHADQPEPLGNNVNCYASPSPAIESGRVYIHFGSYGPACLDSSTGAVLWTLRDRPCQHFRGLAHRSSFQGSPDSHNGWHRSAVPGRSTKTGKTVWKRTEQPTGTTWE